MTLSAITAFVATFPALSAGDRDLQSNVPGTVFQFGESPEHTGSCHGKLYYFQSDVLVDFDGFDTDSSDLTMISWNALEEAFRKSYNSLSEDLCDQSYRRVVDVSINSDPDGEVIIRRGGNQYSVSYTVEAVCRGCNPNSITLFSAPNPDYFRKLISSDGKTIESVEDNPLNTILQRRRAKDDKKSKYYKDSKDSKYEKKNNYYKSGGSKVGVRGKGGEGKGSWQGGKGGEGRECSKA